MRGRLLLAIALFACEEPPTSVDAGTPDAGARDAAEDAGRDVGPPDADAHCPSGTVRDQAGACQRPGIGACPEGFETRGIGCQEIAPAAPCPPGTRARLGARDCAPVGFRTGPIGWSSDESGFGLAPPTPATCAGATYATTTSTACAPLPGCGGPPPAATHHVDPAAVEDATHFRTIGAALAAAPAGSTIAVGPGTYRESVIVTRGVHLVGTCARDVIVQSAGAAAAGIWIRQAVDVTIEGLTLSGHEGGLELDGGARVVARGLAIERSRGTGALLLDGSELRLEASVIRDGVGRPGAAGRGVGVQGRSRVVLDGVDLASAADVGLYVSGDGSRATGRGLVVRGTRPSDAGANGYGIFVNGGQAELGEVVVRGSARVGVRIAGASADVRLAHVAIVDTESRENSAALVVRDGARLRVEGGLIDRNPAFGVAVISARAELEGVVVRRVVGTAAGAFGGASLDDGVLRLVGSVVADLPARGLYAEAGRIELVDSLVQGITGDLAPAVAIAHGGSAVVEGSTLVDAGSAALIVGGTGGTATVTASLLDDTRPGEGARVGAAIVVNAGRVVLARSAVRRSASTGIAVGTIRETTGWLRVVDSAIHGTYGRPGLAEELQEGFGVWVNRGSTLAIERSDLFENQFAAVGVHHLARATLRRSVLRETLANPRGDYGNGLYAEGRVLLEDCVLDDNRTLGIQSHGPFAEILVRRSLIDRTRAKLDGVFGHGIAISFGGRATIAGSEVRGSAGAGIVVVESAALVSGSLVADNAIGIHVEDGSRLREVATATTPPALGVYVTEDTRFLGNATRVGVGALPIPDPIGPRPGG